MFDLIVGFIGGILGTAFVVIVITWLIGREVMRK